MFLKFSKEKNEGAREIVLLVMEKRRAFNKKEYYTINKRILD
jgi:hypothetical protein